MLLIMVCRQSVPLNSAQALASLGRAQFANICLPRTLLGLKTRMPFEIQSLNDEGNVWNQLPVSYLRLFTARRRFLTILDDSLEEPKNRSNFSSINFFWCWTHHDSLSVDSSLALRIGCHPNIVTEESTRESTRESLSFCHPKKLIEKNCFVLIDFNRIFCFRSDWSPWQAFKFLMFVERRVWPSSFNILPH